MSMDMGMFLGTVSRPKRPSLSFDGVPHGTFYDLEITEIEQTQKTDFDTGELEFWPDGNKKMQMVITGKADESLRTAEDDPDGPVLRRFYAPKPSAKLRALAEGIKAAGETEPKPGGKLRITYTHDGQLPTGKRGKPPKEYSVQYKAPSGNADFLGTGTAPSGGALRAPAGNTAASVLGDSAGAGEAPPF